MLRLLERARERQVGVPPLTHAPTTSTRSRPSGSRGSPATSASSGASAPTSGGTPPSWCTGPSGRASAPGGHISTYASSAPACTRSGFNHFFRGKDHAGGGDHIYFQGHASPGMYARAFLEGRLTEAAAGRLPPGALARRPGRRPAVVPAPAAHAGLLGVPDRLHGAGRRSTRSTRPGSTGTCSTASIKDTSDQHVWAFLGDGEMDEPESLGAIGLAAREELDNLTFVINCNLQRLDGPVRGNGKVIQELEAFFRGAGWNVIKVIWGREWDPLLAADTDGALVNLMNTTPDGDYQTYKVGVRRVRPGALLRPRPAHRARWWSDMSDDEIWNLKRGGHDYRKLYAAYKAATEHTGQPTVILAKTIKGWTLGLELRGPQRHPPDEEADARRPEGVPGPALPRHPGLGAGGRPVPPAVLPPGREVRRDAVHDASAATAARRFDAVARVTATAAGDPADRGVRRPQARLRQAEGRHHDGLRPAAQGPDEGQGTSARAGCRSSRTRRARSAWTRSSRPRRSTRRTGSSTRRSTASCSCPTGRRPPGRSCTRGINEAGSVASFTAAGSSYATHGEPMIPLYIFYSMFGFQRTADGLWAAADQMVARLPARAPRPDAPR